jgi:hypothetical protein
MVHVPYKGSAPAVQDLIGGQTQLLIDAGTVLLPQIKGGKLKALAVTGPKRDPQLPDVPTVRELGLGGMESTGFQGLVGPAGLPREVVDKLAAELARVLAQPDLKAKFAAAGSEAHFLGAVGVRRLREGGQREVVETDSGTQAAAGLRRLAGDSSPEPGSKPASDASHRTQLPQSEDAAGTDAAHCPDLSQSLV